MKAPPPLHRELFAAPLFQNVIIVNSCAALNARARLISPTQNATPRRYHILVYTHSACDITCLVVKMRRDAHIVSGAIRHRWCNILFGVDELKIRDSGRESVWRRFVIHVLYAPNATDWVRVWCWWRMMRQPRARLLADNDDLYYSMRGMCWDLWWSISCVDCASPW